MLVYAAKLPGFVTSFAAWILTTVFGDRKAAGLLPAAGAKSYGEYSKCIENRNAYERTFYQEVCHCQLILRTDVVLTFFDFRYGTNINLTGLSVQYKQFLNFPMGKSESSIIQG